MKFDVVGPRVLKVLLCHCILENRDVTIREEYWESRRESLLKYFFLISSLIRVDEHLPLLY